MVGKEWGGKKFVMGDVMSYADIVIGGWVLLFIKLMLGVQGQEYYRILYFMHSYQGSRLVIMS
jgi:hypothetical protein